jgi:hypothetical protein
MSISLTVDFSSWKNQFKGDIVRVNEAVDHTVKTVARRLYERIVDYTPVGDPTLWKWPAHADYTPGSLKDAWKITYEGREATISNNLPYAVRVEFGWSTQAPEGMMRRAALSYPILLDRTAAEYKI